MVVSHFAMLRLNSGSLKYLPPPGTVSGHVPCVFLTRERGPQQGGARLGVPGEQDRASCFSGAYFIQSFPTYRPTYPEVEFVWASRSLYRGSCCRTLKPGIRPA